MNFFDEIPHLRQMIGNHGDSFDVVRPIVRNHREWLYLGIQDFRAGIITDIDGWRREVLPAYIRHKTNRLGGMSLRIELDPVGVYGEVVGLVIWAKVKYVEYGVAVNLFSEGPQLVSPLNSVACNYNLYPSDIVDTYRPWEDFCELS